MNRNTYRLGIESQEIQPPSDPEAELIEQSTKSNLSFPDPVEIVDLPTKGKFYAASHVLHNVESVELRHMTAADEEILTSKTLLQKGVALDRMIQGLLIDKKIKIDDMFVGDKNALVLSARINGVDPIYRTHVTCPVCGTNATHEFNLLEVKAKELPEDVKITDGGTFEITLPKSGKVVELKMLTGNDEKYLKAREENKKKYKIPEKPLIEQLNAIIVSIDGNSNRESIEKFIPAMSAIDSRFIREEYARIMPNLDLKQYFECESCGTFSKVGIPFRAEFFWPQR